MNILITSCAGFIGFNFSQKILSNKNHKVIGIDLIDDYYSIKLKNKFCSTNISSSNPYELSKIMNEINLYFKKTKIKKQERDETDVLNTHGSNKEFKKIVGEYKYTNIKIGIKNLCEWYKSYYKLKI